MFGAPSNSNSVTFSSCKRDSFLHDLLDRGSSLPFRFHHFAPGRSPKNPRSRKTSSETSAFLPVCPKQLQTCHCQGLAYLFSDIGQRYDVNLQTHSFSVLLKGHLQRPTRPETPPLPFYFNTDISHQASFRQHPRGRLLLIFVPLMKVLCSGSLRLK